MPEQTVADYGSWIKSVRLELAVQRGQLPESVEIDEFKAQRCFEGGMSPDQFLRYCETAKQQSRKEGSEAQVWLAGVVIFLLLGMWCLGVPQLIAEAIRIRQR